MNAESLTLDLVQQAHLRLADGLRPTPCAVSTPLSHAARMSIVVKHDYLQATGSFKERGARAALTALNDDERRRGVIAASAGNHALGLAHHGRELNVPVTVVMPRNAPRVKAGRCHALGANVVLHGDSFDEAYRHARSLEASGGLRFVHPFDDLTVMAGQGTLALETLYAFPDVDAIVVPVGGGGLLAGTAVVAKALCTDIRVIGVEPSHANGFVAARQAGRPVAVPVLPTLADGLAVAKSGERSFAAANPLVDEVVTVTEDDLALAMLALWEHHGVVAEGAGVAGLAACLAGRLPELAGKRVAVPVTGRNIDPSAHARALRRASVYRSELREMAAG